MKLATTLGGSHEVRVPFRQQRIDLLSIICQLKQLDSQSAQSVESVKTLYVMKSRPLKDDPVDSLHKSKPLDGQQREDMFPEVRTSSQILKANIRFAHFLVFEYTKFNKFSFFTNLQSILDILLLLIAGTFGFVTELIRAWIPNFCPPYVREQSGNFECKDSTVNTETFTTLPSPQPLLISSISIELLQDK